MKAKKILSDTNRQDYQNKLSNRNSAYSTISRRDNYGRQDQSFIDRNMIIIFVIKSF